MDPELQAFLATLNPDQKAAFGKWSGGSGMGGVNISQGQDALIEGLTALTSQEAQPAPTAAAPQAEIAAPEIPELNLNEGLPNLMSMDGAGSNLAGGMGDMAGDAALTAAGVPPVVGDIAGEAVGQATGGVGNVATDVVGMMDIGGASGPSSVSSLDASNKEATVEGMDSLGNAVKKGAKYGATPLGAAVVAGNLIKDKVENTSKQRINDRIDQQTAFQNRQADKEYSVYADKKSVYYRGDKGHYDFNTAT